MLKNKAGPARELSLRQDLPANLLFYLRGCFLSRYIARSASVMMSPRLRPVYGRRGPWPCARANADSPSGNEGVWPPVQGNRMVIKQRLEFLLYRHKLFLQILSGGQHGEVIRRQMCHQCIWKIMLKAFGQLTQQGIAGRYAMVGVIKLEIRQIDIDRGTCGQCIRFLSCAAAIRAFL